MVATSKEGSGSLAWMICAEEPMASPKQMAVTSKRRVQFSFEGMPKLRCSELAGSIREMGNNGGPTRT